MDNRSIGIEKALIAIEEKDESLPLCYYPKEMYYGKSSDPWDVYENEKFSGSICEDCLSLVNSTNTQPVFSVEKLQAQIGKIEILQEEKVLNPFKPKKSSKMSYFAEKTQVPRQLKKTIKQSIF